MIFGLKKIPHRLIFMSYDDVETPSALIGKKLAPILHLHGQDPFPESLDMIKRVDEDARWGPPLLQKASGREDLKLFEKNHWPLMRLLIHTRFVHAYMPDLTFQSAREYFVAQHPVQGPNGEERPHQDEWRSWDQAKRFSWYQQNLQRSDKELIPKLNEDLKEAEDLIFQEDSVSPGGVGYDDVIFFCRVRYLPLILGLKPGPKLEAYIKGMSQRCDIPLLTTVQRNF